MPSRLDALRARLAAATEPFGGRLPMVFTPTGDDLRGRVNDFLNHAPADLAALLAVVEVAQDCVTPCSVDRGFCYAHHEKAARCSVAALDAALAAWTTEEEG